MPLFYIILTMLIPQFIAGEHGLFGDHESEDIRSILFWEKLLLNVGAKVEFCVLHIMYIT